MRPEGARFSLDVTRMIEAGEQRRARFGDRSPLPPVRFDGSAWPAARRPFDAVVSSRATITLRRAKRVIFGWIYDRQRPVAGC